MTGTTSSIWMPRTRAACVASSATMPTARFRGCWIGPIAPATSPIPWYTGNFDATYRDVLAGCTAMLEQL